MKPLYGKDSVIPKDKKIVFLGDSITDEGTYIAFIDAYLLQHWPEHVDLARESWGKQRDGIWTKRTGASVSSSLRA